MGRQPDYSVGCMNRDTDEKNHKVGAAWVNDDGSIDLQLNDFIVIHGNRSTYLRLFPNGRRVQSPVPPVPKEGDTYTTKDLANDIPDDDVPF